MDELNLERLRQGVSLDAPGGEDLSYDAKFSELEQLIEGQPERQVGDSVKPAEEPPWPQVSAACEELLGRSRHLRLLLWLALAQLVQRGWGGFRDGLDLLQIHLDRHWDEVYPRPDPGDQPDFTERLNILASLAAVGGYQDPLRFLDRLQKAPLAQSPRLGKVAWRDLLLAKGRLQPAEGQVAPDAAALDAIFQDCAMEDLRATAAAVADCAAQVQSIEATLVRRVGAGQTPNLDPLKELLASVTAELNARLARRGEAPLGTAANRDAAAPIPALAAATDGAPAPAGADVAGPVRSREAALALLRKAAEYFERYEPSSPAPLLIRRVCRLTGLSFTEIISDLAPEALKQIELIGGERLAKADRESPASS
jgi:type VI secretion system protein ImpA